VVFHRNLCEREGIEFVLGHALYMRAIHGAKVKNDNVDSQKIQARAERMNAATDEAGEGDDDG
jgi:hypothetical protein